MLTIKEYTEKFGKCWGDFEDSFSKRNVVILSQGLLSFTKETAYNWAGPFDGGYAQFVLSDHSNELKLPYLYKNLGIDCKLRLEADQQFFAIEKAKALKTKKEFKIPNDIPTIDKPIRLWILGNDDTSYSKFYKTKEEALEELNLFIANEPLEFSIVYDFGFVFTN